MTKQSANKVTNQQIHALGLGNVSTFFMRQGVTIFAIPYFQMLLGIDPFLLSLAITIPIFISLIVGPYIGQRCDMFREKHTTRKPILYVACFICATSYGLIWMVPTDWPHSWMLVYLFVVSLLFQLSVCAYSIPYTSMMYEVSREPVERTRVIAGVTFYNKICSTVFHWAFPAAQLSIFVSVVYGIQIMGWTIAVLLIFIFGIVPMLLVKEQTQAQAVLRPAQTPIILLFKSLKTVFANQKFVYLMSLVVCIIGGIGFSATMDYYVIVYSLCQGDVQQGAIWKSVLSSAFAIMGFVALYVVSRAVGKYGKFTTLKWIFIITIVGGCAKWWLYVPGNNWLIVLDAVLCSFTWVGNGVVISSSVADVCDQNEQQNNQDNKGVFIAVHQFISKSCQSLALVASGVALNLIGFDANLTGSQAYETILSMRIILSFGTVAFALLALFILSRMSATNRLKIPNIMQNFPLK